MQIQTPYIDKVTHVIERFSVAWFIKNKLCWMRHTFLDQHTRSGVGEDYSIYLGWS